MGSIVEGPFSGAQTACMGQAWHHPPHQILRCIFQYTGGITLRIANDGSARWFRRLRGHAGKLENDGVGQGLVAVIASHEDRSFRCNAVNHLLGGQMRWVPLLFVPIAAGYPLAFWYAPGKIADTTRELFRALSILQFHAVQLQSAGDEVDVGVIESRKYQPSASVDYPGIGSTPGVDLC